MCVHVFCTLFTAIALLRKYYNILLDCFSDDYITTIGLLSEIVTLKEGFFEEIIAYTNPREANQRILNAIVISLDHDQRLLRVCQLVKALIGSKQDSEEFLEFELGKYVRAATSGMYYE